MISQYSNLSIKKTSIIVLTVFILLLLGTFIVIHDIIITNILAWHICRNNKNPECFIKKTINFPESVYWEDNVYPGFDENARIVMIRNYLDGVHLKRMALNAPDGTVYMFTALPEDWKESQKVIDNMPKDSGKYYQLLQKEAQTIADRAKIYGKDSVPQLHYSVIYNPIQLKSFENRYLSSDEVRIVDNWNKETIAYCYRLMRYYYIFEPEPIGGCISMSDLYYKAIYGEVGLYEFDDKVFFKHRGINNIINNFECKRNFKKRIPTTAAKIVQIAKRLPIWLAKKTR